MLCLQAILIFNFVRYEPARYNDNYSYPVWADGLGWCLTLASVIPIFVVAFYKMYKAGGSTLSEVRVTVGQHILLIEEK